MSDFLTEQINYQIEWRKANIKNTFNGRQNGIECEYVVLKELWKDTLWEGIRIEFSKYIESTNKQVDFNAHNLVNSWVLNANLYFYAKINQNLKKYEH